MNLRVANMTMAGKLGVIAVAMLAFGYALGPIYNAICEMTGINILALGERNNTGVDVDKVVNTQIDRSRSITVEFDANSRGPWEFKPAQRSMQVHPGEMVTVMYEFQNVQNRRMAAQAIPSYAPLQAGAHFNKLQCFCFNQYTLEPGEKKSWPVVFVIDPSCRGMSPRSRCPTPSSRWVVRCPRPRSPRPRPRRKTLRRCVCERACRTNTRARAQGLFPGDGQGGLLVVRRLAQGSDFEQDSARLNPLHIILVGFGAVFVFVVALIALVNWVVAK
jgi:cytochrome c oxidase assembly protein subunit 11